MLGSGVVGVIWSREFETIKLLGSCVEATDNELKEAEKMCWYILKHRSNHLVIFIREVYYMYENKSTILMYLDL